MGVERAVGRWYILRQSLLNEIAILENRLAQTETVADEKSFAPTVANEDADIAQQLARAQKKLSLLGPCPRPMMG